ncbi:chaplin [Streptomyces sp. NPDC127066]|uniref:chaplin n=1 Tax=Streptomyces sp. NPDC127066 TaxID=3347125 RepID=UPI00364E177B
MRRAARNRVLAVAAASGAMAVALPASAVFAADGADAGATAADSPGVLSGNNVQVPLSGALNLCGNTADVVGLLNPAVGNVCENRGTAKADGAETGGGSDTSGGATADGRVTDSPGLLSGNGLQLPVDLPVNVSGNSVNAVGVGNPAIGNQSVNGGDHAHPRVPRSTPAPEPSAPTPPVSRTTAPRHEAVPDTPDTATSTLARTGADLTAPALAGGAASLLAGALLYRRFRPSR